MQLESPEIKGSRWSRSSQVYQSLRGLHKRFRQWLRANLSARGIRQKILLRKWQHNADHREFSWDWDAIPYNRISVVNMLLDQRQNQKYLEIGCASNSLFQSVPVLDKIGVDPHSGGTHTMTSDAFFESNSERFDVVFIDGLHEYHQVRRDINNALEVINPGGWILLHDMLPRNWKEQHIPILNRGDWTGDVWKVAFELEKTKGLEFQILLIDHGVGVIKVNDQNARLEDLTAELSDKQFRYYYDNFHKLPVSSFEQAYPWLSRSDSLWR